MKKDNGFWEGIADAFSFSMMLLAAMMLLTLLLAGCSALPTAPSVPVKNRSDVVAELNRYRSNQGLRMVTSQPSLGQLASVRALNAWPYRYGPLTKGHQRFESDVDSSGIVGQWFGENLYSDNGQLAASDIISGWHTSPGHKAMMQRRSTTECDAAEANDGKRAVIALVCMDRYNKELISW